MFFTQMANTWLCLIHNSFGPLRQNILLEIRFHSSWLWILCKVHAVNHFLTCYLYANQLSWKKGNIHLFMILFLHHAAWFDFLPGSQSKVVCDYVVELEFFSFNVDNSNKIKSRALYVSEKLDIICKINSEWSSQ